MYDLGKERVREHVPAVEDEDEGERAREHKAYSMPASVRLVGDNSEDDDENVGEHTYTVGAKARPNRSS